MVQLFLNFICCCCSSPEFVGERIPTLYETVALCEELDLLLFIDVKDPANVKLSQLVFLTHCNDYSNVSCSKCQLAYHQLICQLECRHFQF